MADYNKVGLFTLQGDRFLMCRKNNTTSKLILPGGCIEAGESARECLQREIHEELGNVAVCNLEYIGHYADFAAVDDPAITKTLEMQLFRGDLSGNPTASSEIVELVWFGPDSDRSQLTPIMINHILPDLLKRGLLDWNH
ncbi:MAG: NUDIX domain-containing protein [Candidatus Omnitrophota bacterium]|jgi:8-oxo-dGTP pyrophosphatase MutT (NUDIX family)|nr:MAG: NUDIX domain-containing protein [Candidatus Omnitrophota bacterium]